jgi:beta-phosphoglucomutase
MDGVLVDSADAHYLSWQQLARECGRDVTREQFAATFGRQNRDIVPVLIGDVPGATLDSLSDRKEEIYREMVCDSAPIVDGAVELVRALSQAGCSLAVGSSGPRANIDLVLEAMGVAELMLTIISGDDVTRGKPDPQVFALACAGLEIEPTRCIVVEDAPAGVEAARGAGTRTVAVLMHHSADSFEKADLVVNRLADLSADSVFALVDN